MRSFSVDRSTSMGHKVRRSLAGAVLITVLMASVGLSWASRLDVPIPPKATSEAGDGRFRSPLRYEATIRWMARRLSRKGFKGRFEALIDLPEAVAAHFASSEPRSEWRGVNVARYGGQVWIFVIAR